MFIKKYQFALVLFFVAYAVYQFATEKSFNDNGSGVNGNSAYVIEGKGNAYENEGFTKNFVKKFFSKNESIKSSYDGGLQGSVEENKVDKNFEHKSSKNTEEEHSESSINKSLSEEFYDKMPSTTADDALTDEDQKEHINNNNYDALTVEDKDYNDVGREDSHEKSIEGDDEMKEMAVQVSDHAASSEEEYLDKKESIPEPTHPIEERDKDEATVKHSSNDIVIALDEENIKGKNKEIANVKNDNKKMFDWRKNEDNEHVHYHLQSSTDKEEDIGSGAFVVLDKEEGQEEGQEEGSD